MRRLALVLLALVAVLSVACGVTVPLPPAGADGNEAPTAPVGVRSISAGFSHTCAILHDATVARWGNGTVGALGLGNQADRGDGPGEMGTALPRVDLGTGRTATALAAGFNHTCALLDDASVKCWGSNADGQLGQGDASGRGTGAGQMGDDLPAVDLGTGRTAVAIAASVNTSCAILDDASLKCWGDNGLGQLGQGDTDDRGDAAGEMGDALTAIDLGTGRTAEAVTTGSATCAVLDNGTVKCWGQSANGRLGSGALVDLGDGPGEMGDALPTVALGTGRTATAVTEGNSHVCVLLDNATVKCWGSGVSGALGSGSTGVVGDLPGEMGDTLPTVNLGTGRTAVTLSAGVNQTCAVLDDATVKCWGQNTVGQLGLGDTANRGDANGEMGDTLPTVDLGTGRTALAVTGGGNQTCALLDDATLKCWGFNAEGQLGQGDNVNRGDAALEMGDVLLPVDVNGAVGPAPAITIGKAADQVAVAVGEDIDYHLTVTNTGGVPLTGIAIVDPVAPDCDDTTSDMAIGQIITIDCSLTTTVADIGTVSNVATVDTNETAAVGSNQVDVTVDAYQPDGPIRVGSGPFRGNGTYNTTAATQGRSANVGNLATATFTVQIQNDGTATDDIGLQGLGSTNRFTVTYKRGAANITNGVVAGTFTLHDVPPAGTRNITVRIQARAGTPVGATLARRLTATSAATGSQDAVKATVTRR